MAQLKNITTLNTKFYFPYQSIKIIFENYIDFSVVMVVEEEVVVEEESLVIKLVPL